MGKQPETVFSAKGFFEVIEKLRRVKVTGTVIAKDKLFVLEKSGQKGIKSRFSWGNIIVNESSHF